MISRPQKHHQSGFTLIEVVVAMAITAVIGIVAYGGLDSALAAMERSEAQGKKLNEMNILWTIMSRDLRQIVARPVRDEYGDEWVHALNAPESSLIAIQLSRTGWANPRPELFIRSSMQRVQYLLEEDKLIRETWYVMDRADDSESIRTTLVEGVTSFKLRYLDVNTQNPAARSVLGGQWRDSWPYPYPEAGQRPSESLPLAIEVALEIDGWGEVKRIFEMPGSEQ
jgi:general secretion pathway protein J